MPAARVTFLHAELQRWDMLATPLDALFLPFFADERPLRGAAGLCDWRLCGRLSRLLGGGRVSGAYGETTLMPPGRRLPFGRLVLFGLDETSRFDEARASESARAILRIAERAQIWRWGLALPGRSTGRLSARRALELFLAELAVSPSAMASSALEVQVVESAAGQKEAAGLLA